MANFFVFLVETRFHHVGQGDLELLPQVIHLPQPPKVLGMSHRTCPQIFIAKQEWTGKQPHSKIFCSPDGMVVN